MWKNRTSEIDLPAYVPEDAPARTNTIQPVPASNEYGNLVITSSVWRPPAVAPAPTGSLLGAGLHIKGEISGSEDLLVDGNVDGLIQMEGHSVTVGAGAKIVADILAAEIVVYGDVKGNLRAHHRIEIKKHGSVVGELTSSRVMIEDGAYFKGSIEIDRRAPIVADPADLPNALTGSELHLRHWEDPKDRAS